MTSVTGPPAKMADRREDLTPMLRQYVDLCAEYDDALVLFRVGDFYKSFCETAEEVARTCELTLTEREDSTGTYAMAGIPVDNAATYLDRLLDMGYRLAIADQVEDPEEATGLVDRAVTRILTPGTLTDDELLGADDANYVACLAHADEAAGTDRLALAAIDVSTGECLVTSATEADRIAEELERVAPAELVVGPDVPLSLDGLAVDPMVTAYDPDVFDSAAARDRTAAYVSNPAAVLDSDAELCAAGALLAYAEYTQGDDGPLDYVSRIQRYDPRESLRIDATARRGLELFEARGASEGTTLLSVLDETSSALGRRCLAEWLRRPLVDRDAIEARHDAVAEFAERSLVREEARDLLGNVYDIERLMSRISRERANARDLRSLESTLAVVPDLKDALDGVESARLQELHDSLDELRDVRSLIDRAIAPDPPQEITEGDVIREGFDDELDDIRSTEREGREWVADLEARERERTGIDSLEVGYNQVHGYYIEVTNPNLDRVPDDYTRRQTLKNAERFYTPELKQREDEILSASERADALEYDLFREVRSDVAAEVERIQALADALAQLDVLATLADVAVANDYVRPEMGTDGIDIEGGRHPVVERTRDDFVPNDADLGGPDSGRVAIITGPNMSGKSTYMRQVALIAILAQLGSFVPADSARLPVLDRVFTRVGASDDIAGGQSTFMREMAELTDILHDASDDSLVLLDEVGRGTSTADGLAIAWATAEFIHDEIGAYTLFATHYHDLTGLADERDGVFNLHFTARRDGDDVTFHHRVAEGASSSSYGVEVAQLAGVPDPVVDRSREVIEQGGPTSTEQSAAADPADPVDAATNGASPGRPSGDASPDSTPAETVDGGDVRQASLDTVAETLDAHGDTDETVNADSTPDLAAELRDLDIARMTPLEALNTLHDLKTTLADE